MKESRHSSVHSTALFWLMLIALLSSCTGESPKPNTSISFNERWEFSEKGTDNWYRASVPGSVQQDLIRQGLLVDPRIDSNEFIVQELEGKDWIFRKEFSLSELPQRRQIQFDFEGLDTYCDVFINDSLVGQSKNMFLPLEVVMDYGDFQEENTMELHFKSTLRQGVIARGNQLNGLTAGNDRGEEQVSPFVRKAPYQFGWDWAPRVLTTGISKDIVVRGLDDIRIYSTGYDYNISQGADVKGFVRMTYYCHVDGFKVVATGPWGERTDLLKPVSCPETVFFGFEIPDADLWTIDKVGHQPNPVEIKVYDGDVLVHSEQFDMSFREIELIQATDSIGTSFLFKLNGEKRFIKGANYIPQSMFPAEVTDEDYRKLLTQVKESNIDMLRVWGGGIYEEDIFYNLCDSLGILVWQDFMFAGAMYPRDKAFLQSVMDEVSHQYERLRSHPSLVLWCGNNEVDVAWKNWGWQGVLGIDSTQAQQDYDQLFVESIGLQLDGEAYIHSSPLSNWGTPENFNHHNMHYWGVWHGTDDFDGFETNVPRFMSEYGFQSFPMPATFKGEVDSSAWEINSPALFHRQKSYKGTKELERHLYQHYPQTENFERFCYLSQLNQALAMEMAINAHRGSNGHCMGSLYWQLNDVWAAPSWSTIDVKGNWKAAHYSVQDRYKDVIVMTRNLVDSLNIIAVNDRPIALNGILKLSHLDFLGNTLFEEEMPLALMPREDKIVYSLALNKLHLTPELTRNSLLRIKLIEQGEELDEWLHYFVEPKELQLEPLSPQNLKVEVLGSRQYRFTASKFCKDLYFYLPEDTGARWSANCIDLFPGESRMVSYLGGEMKGDIRLLSLNGKADTLP